MPELPEVETVARGVDAQVRGRQIVSVWLGSKPEPFRSSPAEIVATLTGSTIQCARRVGKHIVVELVRKCDRAGKKNSRSAARAANREDRQAQWLVHLGMTGRLLVSKPEVPLPLHTHAIVQLDDGRELRFVDPRRFGRLTVLNLPDTGVPPHRHESPSRPIKSRPRIDKNQIGDAKDRSDFAGFVGTGQEPLDISPDAFRALFRGRRTPIKSALLNQSLLQGVGNIYADESLFRAGIRPRRQAARLTGRELARLLAAIQAVLAEAIAAGGSSVSDYVDADGGRGFFQLEHKVYLRTGQPCLICQTPICRIVLGGRGTHFCPKCQR